MKTYRKLKFAAYSIDHRKQKRFEAVYEIDDFMGTLGERSSPRCQRSIASLGMKAYRPVHGSLKVVGD